MGSEMCIRDRCADVAAARATLTKKLHALKTKAMAIENMETLSSVQRTLGNRVAPDLLDKLDDALGAIADDTDDANVLSQAMDAHVEDDEDGLAAFLGTETPVLEPLPEPSTKIPSLRETEANEAMLWLTEA